MKENPSCLKLVKDALKGIYLTFRYQPEEDKWYRLADAPLYENKTYTMSSLQEKLYVFPKSPRIKYNSTAGEIFDPTLNR